VQSVPSGILEPTILTAYHLFFGFVNEGDLKMETTWNNDQPEGFQVYSPGKTHPFFQDNHPCSP